MKTTGKTPEAEAAATHLTWIRNKETQCRTIRGGKECKIQGQDI